MSSAHVHLPEYRFYGSASLRRSRDQAAALTGCIMALSAAAVFALTAGKTIPSTPSAPPAMMIMRVMEETAPADIPPVREDLQKILAGDSEFDIPAPPEALAEAPPEPRSPDPLPEPAPEPVPEPRPEPQKKAPHTKRRTAPKTPVKARPTDAPRESRAAEPAGEISGSSASAAAVAERKTEGELRSRLLARLIAEIEKRKSYPRQARRSGAEGTSTLEIHIDASGVVQTCGLAQGSGSATLDAATRRLGDKLVGLNTGVTGRAFRVIVPVTYSLRDK